MLLYLMVICYFTVGLDFAKEIACERNEIDIINVTLEESIHIDTNSSFDFLKIDNSFIVTIPLLKFRVISIGYALTPPERGPPEAVQVFNQKN